MCNRLVGISNTHYNQSYVYFQKISMLSFNNKGNNIRRDYGFLYIADFKQGKVYVEEFFLWHN